MHILIVHNAYIHAGGEDTVVQNEISALEEAGITVSVHRVQTPLGVNALWKSVQALWQAGEVYTFEKNLKALRPNIVHFHNVFPLLSPSCFQAAQASGAKVVLTLHNYRPLCLNGLFSTPAKELCERCADGGSYGPGILRGCYRGSHVQSLGLAAQLLIQRSAYEAVDRFIAPSAFLRDKFIRYGFAADKIMLQGHFLPQMSASEPVAPEPYVLYLGRLSEEKGVRWLLSTFASSQGSLRLKIAGTGPLEGEVRRAAQDGFVEYLGYVSGSAKDDLVRHAAAVVVPSECYENFPLAVPEANAWGVPAVVANLGGLQDIVISGENGFHFPRHNADALRECFQKIWPASQASALRSSAQRYAHTQFSKASFLQKRLALYEDLTASTVASR